MSNKLSQHDLKIFSRSDFRFFAEEVCGEIILIKYLIVAHINVDDLRMNIQLLR